MVLQRAFYMSQLLLVYIIKLSNYNITRLFSTEVINQC